MKTGRFCRTMVGALVIAASLFAWPACAVPRGRVYVRVGPPVPVIETRVVAPGPDFVWVPGYHAWNAAYIWVPGRWERPPRERAVWVPAHWQHERYGWYLVEGHWR
jgi:hypothetical protein